MEDLAIMLKQNSQTPDKILIMNQKKASGKYVKATKTIGKFTDDTKGLRAGNVVRFPLNRTPDTGKVIGTLKRIFIHLKDNPPKNKGDEEARIKGPIAVTNPKFSPPLF